MHPSFYRPLLKRAFNLVWGHKTFWLLGFLAAFAGSGSQYQILSNQFQNVSDGQLGLGDSIFAVLGANLRGGAAKTLIFLAREAPPSFYWVLLVAIFLIALLIWTTLVAQGALFNGVAGLETGDEEAGGLKKLWSAGQASFWPLFGIALSVKILGLFVLAAVGLPLSALLLWLWPSLNALIAVIFVFGVLLFIIFGVVGKFAFLFHLLDKNSWSGSLARAGGLFAEHWLVSVETVLLLLAADVLAGLVFILLLLALAAPTTVLGVIFAQAGFWLGVQALVVLAAAGFFLLIILLGSALATFHYAVWTLLFLKIREKRHLSKIERTILGWAEKYG